MGDVLQYRNLKVYHEKLIDLESNQNNNTLTNIILA